MASGDHDRLMRLYGWARIACIGDTKDTEDIALANKYLFLTFSVIMAMSRNVSVLSISDMHNVLVISVIPQ